MMKIIKLPIVLTLVIGLSGCSSLVTEYIQRADSFDYDNITSEKQIAALGFKKGRYCSSTKAPCISYLSGSAIERKRLKYETELGSGSRLTQVSLNLAREAVPNALNGTVVLIHGFRASKEFMLNTALYFRFLGFDVLVPDLLGHGESDGEKAFGVNDRYIINELISANHTGSKSLLLLGNSMGAVTAVYLANMRDDVSGIILQAPMLKFDEAVLHYTKAKYPYLHQLISDDIILDGAVGALNEANLSVNDTDISPMLSPSNLPMLIFASSQDRIAPYYKFEHLTSERIRVEELPDRSHSSMGIVGDKSSQIIIDWLKEQVVEQRSDK